MNCNIIIRSFYIKNGLKIKGMLSMYELLNKRTDIKPLLYHDKCDKYDYLIAIGCGAIAGLIDIIFVGDPQNSILGTWTDKITDNTVMKFAKLCGWSPKAGNEKNISSAIGFLEKKFKVNYDQTTLNGIDRMSSKNHHMKSLAHSPDIVGLFFSVLNQFTDTSTFLSDGKLITISTTSSELKGNNFLSKLFCGVVNWFGHLMSDAAGSSGSRSGSGRGSGIVIPFYELFGFCNFGKFNISNNPNSHTLVTLSQLAVRAFEEGYDARFGAAAAIPVILCDMLIRVIWAIRKHFYYRLPLKECIPTEKHDDLRVMLIIGNGVLCIMDIADASIRFGGNWLKFFLRLNLIAWFRFAMLVIKEVCIRIGISAPLEKMLESFRRINEALSEYLRELEKIDIERFRLETEEYNKTLAILNESDSEDMLNSKLSTIFNELNIPKPYSGSFDDFMNDNSSVLEF